MLGVHLRPARRRLAATDAIMRSVFLVPLLACSACAYLGHATQQARYAHQQDRDPRLGVYKHMVERKTFFVFGRLLHVADRDRTPMAVVAVSDAFQQDEVVDVNRFSRKDSYFGLNLPAGEYRLLVVRDQDGDGFFDEHELVGGRELVLSQQVAPDRVVGEYDIDLREPVPFAARLSALHVPVGPAPPDARESIFYPRGTIRTLDDDIFSPEMATLGMYEPAAFLERAPMLFYALEEDVGYKVPVVFVHGIDGSAREFAELVAHLDRRRYRPWFFHYPSGSSLSQLSEMFYRLFLSGRVIPLEEMPMVVVAHSMGGLVVRDALNRCTGDRRENRVARLVTIASPLGGHPDAAGAGRAPLVLPSWRDLNPASAFIRDLHRRPLPPGLEYHLFFTYGDPRTLRAGENSDGVVPISAQLPEAAQAEAREQFGFNDTHTGVLRDPLAIRRVIGVIEEVHSVFPEEHLREFDKGGYPVRLGPGYTPTEAYVIRTVGHWLDALASGRIAPAHPLQAHFLEVLRGAAAPSNPAETGWLKFVKEYPDRSALDAAPAAVGGPGVD